MIRCSVFMELNDVVQYSEDLVQTKKNETLQCNTFAGGLFDCYFFFLFYLLWIYKMPKSTVAVVKYLFIYYL